MRVLPCRPQDVHLTGRCESLARWRSRQSAIGGRGPLGRPSRRIRVRRPRPPPRQVAVARADRPACLVRGTAAHPAACRHQSRSGARVSPAATRRGRQRAPTSSTASSAPRRRGPARRISSMSSGTSSFLLSAESRALTATSGGSSAPTSRTVRSGLRQRERSECQVLVVPRAVACGRGRQAPDVAREPGGSRTWIDAVIGRQALDARGAVAAVGPQNTVRGPCMSRAAHSRVRTPAGSRCAGLSAAPNQVDPRQQRPPLAAKAATAGLARSIPARQADAPSAATLRRGQEADRLLKTVAPVNTCTRSAVESRRLAAASGGRTQSVDRHHLRPQA